MELVGHTKATPRLVGGIYGRNSAVGRMPMPRDIYLEALFSVSEDEDGVRDVTSQVVPERGVYIAASQIVRVDLMAEEPVRIGP